MDRAIEVLQAGGQAFNMKMLFVGESHKKALQMSDVEVAKRFTAYSFKKIKPDPKSETPKVEKPTGKGIKRTLGGKPLHSDVKQSSTDTPTTEVEAPVDCNKCGGQHPSAIVKKWGAKYMCPFEFHEHPHLNTDGSVPFLLLKEGKPYKDHPWDQTDADTKVTTPQYRLKMKHMLVDGKYQETPVQDLPSRAEKKGETDPKGFLSQITKKTIPPITPI